MARFLVYFWVNNPLISVSKSLFKKLKHKLENEKRYGANFVILFKNLDFYHQKHVYYPGIKRFTRYFYKETTKAIFRTVWKIVVTAVYHFFDDLL